MPQNIIHNQIKNYENCTKMINQRVYVLRLGLRRERDKRITMHILLTARALSASGVIYSGERDKELLRPFSA